MNHDDGDCFTIEGIRAELRRALRHGGRAAHLVEYAPGLVALLCPAQHRGRPPHERALVTEEMIRSAISALGGRADVLAIVLGLAPGTLELTLEERRRRAAAALDILPATFRRDRHEGLLLWDLATEIYRRADDREDAPSPGQAASDGYGGVGSGLADITVRARRVRATMRRLAVMNPQGGRRPDLRRAAGRRTGRAGPAAGPRAIAAAVCPAR